MNRLARWLKNQDGVHVLLADRSEIGWRGIEERDSKHLGLRGSSAEFTPEHVHHNYKHTDAYTKSKEARGKTAASAGEFSKTGLSHSEYW